MDGTDLIPSTTFVRREFEDIAPTNADRTLFVFEGGKYREATAHHIVDRAREIISQQFRRGMPVLRDASALKTFLQLHMTRLKQMHLAALFLNRRKRLIACHEIFRGTVDEVDIYPREIARDALESNAKSVIFVQNFPSGEPTFSETDPRRWARVCEALGMIDIEVLDVLLIGAKVISCVERGWLDIPHLYRT